MINILIEDPDHPGGWLPLQNPAVGLELEGSTLSTLASSVKRTTASNPFIPGTYTTRAVPDNITTNIAVNVRDKDLAQVTVKVEHLVSLFTRASFKLIVRYETKAWMSTAQAADYSINNQREFMHAGLSVVSFNVPLLPARVEVSL